MPFKYETAYSPATAVLSSTIFLSHFSMDILLLISPIRENKVAALILMPHISDMVFGSELTSLVTDPPNSLRTRCAVSFISFLG